ncbi:MAG TPA: CHAP domain-containing protein, partial [Acetobacteraceae bacterium]|nr:CHAP domain-containing protein [Acetobacteraceae bacterium]
MLRKALARLRIVGVLALAGALAACASSRGYRGGGGARYAGLECVPFARELSGIALYGDAADWWDGAASRYARSEQPAIGGVLVFRRSGRLPEGHVSVVSRLLGARQIAV